MSPQSYRYVIVGGGLAGASAVDGVRERDANGTILLLADEKHLPYNRPPLSKKLWFGQKKVEEIFVHDEGYYADRGVELALGVRAEGLDPKAKTLAASNGTTYGYGRLLLATGGRPRRLGVPGGDLKGLCYYRSLDDFRALQPQAHEGASAVVIGGGFIGSEMAAALNVNKVDVTMVFPDDRLVAKVFPPDLGRALLKQYEERGVRVLTGDVPVSFERKGEGFTTHTRAGQTIQSDMVVVGIGIEPAVELAAGLAVENGIVVTDGLQTSSFGVYAAGDNAAFPYAALGRRMRIEHWDNALNQGACAGRNMAGAAEPYDYMPYFFSDLFEFGYEAVGDIDPRLDTFTDWVKENDTGVIYYLADGKVRGAMMCNVWDKVDAARELIRAGKHVTAEDLRGAIK
jgi:3-phenylpropionate/trans-cinnamate dioxygenase ferredoxin reductase subunit